MRVALLSHNARAGDAIGNTLADKLAFFLERGADARAILEDTRALHPDVRRHCTHWPFPEPHGEPWEFLRGCDLAIAEFGQFYPLLTLLPLLAGTRTRVLIDYHGVTPPELWGPLRREALDRGARHRGIVWSADGTLVHSAYTRHELQRLCDYPDQRLHLLGFPVEADESRSENGRTCRERLGLGRARVLLFVGRLAPNKRAPLLVEAVARLRDLDPPVHVLIVGDGRDAYAAEAQRCGELAGQLGVADRVHLLGHLTGAPLRDAYRVADVFVIPSLWESFCIPAVEAMAAGLPVVAARTSALPETIADAGLTFAPDDTSDLERQLRRLFDDKSEIRNPKSETNPQSEIRKQRVAIVSFRYGGEFAGGAEASLRTIAETLAGAGCAVEVFTTCTVSESDWADELPEGTDTVSGIPVHRFRLDPHDRPRHLESVRAVWQREGEGDPNDETQIAYIRHSIHSARLVEALAARAAEFDAVIVGPYLFGLTHDVALALPEKTLLLPCFHDEPFARMPRLLDAYRHVGGILYHSPEEQQFAEAALGVNHPGAACVGTWLDLGPAGAPSAADVPYLAYCGRYSRQKDLPLLIAYARRYHAERPGRFRVVFMGQGEVAIPAEPWARDLGFVQEQTKRDVLAGAAALVQLSRYESLSLAALEAWAQGVPVLASRRCAALVGQFGRCGGGRAVEGYDEFARALDDLWDNPDRWREMGRRGADYVRAVYGSREAYAARLLAAVRGLGVPLAEKMRRRGHERAALFTRAAWKQRFAAAVEQVLHAEPRPCRHQVEVTPRGDERTAAAGARGLLVSARIVNRGTHLILADGPARVTLRCRVVDEQGCPVGDDGAAPLPGPLMPGRAATAALPVPVPETPGTYQVAFWAEIPGTEEVLPEQWLRLTVQQDAAAANGRAPALESAQAALAEADRLRRLPDDYDDVTEGLFARLKQRIKGKLLGNFKRAYVDVLSRQQSGFNREATTAIQELVECCAALDHAVSVLLQRVALLEERSAISFQPSAFSHQPELNTALLTAES